MSHRLHGRLRTLIVGSVLVAGMLPATPVAAATVPAGFTESIVASGLASPTAMAFAPDGRLFVTQQGGALRIIKSGALLATPFLTLTVASSGERGLLGVAFDPAFATNQFVYVYYTTASVPIHNRISRFTANGDVAVPGSEVVVLELDNLSTATNHNGGAIHFGPDGKLYVGVGENATSANSQSLSNLLGKMLRLNSDGTIPTDNPYFNSANGNNRMIWATGLRNPFTFAFQPGTGRLFINDVGQSAWEEVNDGVAGSNYGWPASEGDTSTSGHRAPLYWYGHGSGATLGCAITGGAFYNPATAQFPSTYTASYFFADYCGGWINRLSPSNGYAAPAQTFATGISSPVDLQAGPEGSLYYLARGNGGHVGKITFTGTQAPLITAQPQSTTVSVGASATFTVGASGTAPLSYQWQRNDAPIAGATSASYTLSNAQLTDSGAQFRAMVTNGFGTATSNAATLTVVSNTAPTATITAPAANAPYSAGQTISYAGTGSDTQDGTLPPSAFTWQVDFHHTDNPAHTHPFIPPTTGATSGSFTIPNTGETSANVFYRIHLTVRDSGGLTHTTFRDIVPRTVTLTVTSSPAGASITVDGQPRTAPYVFTSVVGMLRSIGTTSPQTLAGITQYWKLWSDGGKQTHTITTPSTNTTYKVTLRPRGKR